MTSKDNGHKAIVHHISTVTIFQYLVGRRPGFPETPDRPGFFSRNFCDFRFVPFLLPSDDMGSEHARLNIIKKLIGGLRS